METASTSKKMAKKIAGKKGVNHINLMLYTLRLYKMRNELQRVPRYLIYYFYKILMEKLKDQNEKAVNVNDYQMKLIPNDEGISKELRVFHVHEPLVTKIVKKEIKDGMTCVEIGCNIGYYALLESKLVGKNGKVIAIEPSPINFHCLGKNLVLNKNSNVKSYNFAVGNMDSQTQFLISNTSNWSKVIEQSLSNSEDVITVTLKKLDTFAVENSLGQIDFIRMDIEGYENKAYEGMKDIIKQYKPKILVEIHSQLLGKEKTIEFLNILKIDGYESKFLIPRSLDLPWIYNTKLDIMNIDLNHMIKQISEGTIFGDFNIFLN